MESHNFLASADGRRRAIRRLLRQPRGVCLVGALVVFALVSAGCGATSQPVGAGARPTPTPPKSSVSYVALGASDAVGIGAENPATQAYVPILISRLPAGAHRLNLGVSGIALHDALQRELPQALAAHPTVVTVWLVVNDFKGCVSLPQYSADLETLLGQLQSQTQAQVFMANLPDVNALPAIQDRSFGAIPCLDGLGASQIRGVVAQWNAALAAAAQRHHVVLVDLSFFNATAHPEYISGDGLHPSSAGYLQLANLFWAEITAHNAVPRG